MNLYVGNLPYRITEDQLKETFEEFGRVSSCTIIKDKVTGQSKGFGFLEMPESSEAQAAISSLNGRDLMGARSTSTRPGRARTVRPPAEASGPTAAAPSAGRRFPRVRSVRRHPFREGPSYGRCISAGRGAYFLPANRTR